MNRFVFLNLSLLIAFAAVNAFALDTGKSTLSIVRGLIKQYGDVEEMLAVYPQYLYMFPFISDLGELTGPPGALR